MDVDVVDVVDVAAVVITVSSMTAGPLCITPSSTHEAISSCCCTSHTHVITRVYQWNHSCEAMDASIQVSSRRMGGDVGVAVGDVDVCVHRRMRKRMGVEEGKEPVICVCDMGKENMGTRT